ncbi:MAG: DUF11 domain-containing protein [Chloroflexi bacterium]|nr:DUF11 domain-containing protein [Chloroflexota bacterium]
MRRIAALIVALMTAFGLMGTAVFWLHPPRIHAAPETLISVTTALDELDANGLCSLREAIQAANTDTAVDACAAGSGENDVISIPAGHYLLTLADPVGVVEENGNATGDLDILHSVALVGAGSAQTIIDGNGIDRVFHQPGAATQVAVSDVTVQGGDLGVGTSVNYSGGGFSLISGCALTLTNVLVTQNQASPGQPLLSSGGGGGIYNNGGQLTLQNATVSGNIAGFGGGVYNGGRLTIINSSILSNQSTYYGAGIIHAGTSDVNIQSSAISYNVAGSNGGGLYLTGGTTNLTNVTVSHNRASQYLGGGVWVYYEGVLAVNIDHSTIYANFAGTGGGIYNTHQQGLLMMGVAPTAPQAGLITLKNSIVAANTGGNCGRSPQTSAFVSMGYNIDSANDCEFQAASDQINTDPTLGPLQDNGGPSQTHGLRADSPAIDAADCADTLGNPVTVDQRGVVRPQGAACDSGSFEFVPGQNSDLRLVKSVSAATAGPAEPLVYTLTIFNDGPDLAANVMVTDTLPAGLTGVTAVAPNWSCQTPAGLVVCVYTADLPVGAAPDVRVEATTPANSGILTNTAVVAAPNFDVDLSQNQDDAVTRVTSPAADLQIMKTAVPTAVPQGEPLTYTLVITNAGPDAASFITLTDTLPDGVSYLSHTAVGWSCQDAAAVTCTRAALAAGEIATVTLHTLAPGLTGTITNTAVITSAVPDPQVGNNTASVATAVLPASGAQADLAVTQTITPTAVHSGEVITVTLTVTNAGPDPAESLSLQNSLPVNAALLAIHSGGWQCVDQSPTVLCTLPGLETAVSSTVQLVLRVGLSGRELVNETAVSAATADLNNSNNRSVMTVPIILPPRAYLPMMVKSGE